MKRYIPSADITSEIRTKTVYFESFDDAVDYVNKCHGDLDTAIQDDGNYYVRVALEYPVIHWKTYRCKVVQCNGSNRIDRGSVDLTVSAKPKDIQRELNHELRQRYPRNYYTDTYELIDSYDERLSPTITLL